MDKVKIGGIMESEGRSLVRILSLPAGPEATASLLSLLGENNIGIELMVDGYDASGLANISLVVDRSDLGKVLSLLGGDQDAPRYGSISHMEQATIISIFGPHLREHPGIAGRMITALANAKVSPLAISTSISSISCVVPEDAAAQAVKGLLEVFEAPFQVKKRPKDY